MKEKILVILFLLTVFCAAPVFAQEKTSVSESLCEMVVEDDFVGKEINYYVDYVNIQEVLNYFNEQTGCNFIAEEKIEKTIATVRINNMPWNMALGLILESNNLGIMPGDGASSGTEKKQILITIKDKILSEAEKQKNSVSLAVKDVPLITTFVRLNYLCAGYCGFPTCRFGGDYPPRPPAKIVKLVTLLLSRRGSVEVDNRTNTLIITETEKRLDSIIKQVKLWDIPNPYVEQNDVTFDNLDNHLDDVIKIFEGKDK